jgi:hypothetical protein
VYEVKKGLGGKKEKDVELSTPSRNKLLLFRTIQPIVITTIINTLLSSFFTTITVVIAIAIAIAITLI